MGTVVGVAGRCLCDGLLANSDGETGSRLSCCVTGTSVLNWWVAKVCVTDVPVAVCNGGAAVVGGVVLLLLLMLMHSSFPEPVGVSL